MLTVTQIHPLFGAEIGGMSLRDGCTPSVADEIRATLCRYGVIVLRGQGITDEQFQDFAAQLGTVFDPTAGVQVKDRSKPSAVFTLTNVDANGDLLKADDPLRPNTTANQLWHIDNTFTRPRARFSLLIARIIPPQGAETEFADTRVAYERLSAARKAEVDPLVAWHSIIHSRASVGFFDWPEEQRRRYAEPIRRPLVQLHRESGRRSLCIASHICRIEGMSPEGSQALARQLIAEAAQRDRVYSHHWRMGDVVIWDNHAVMHRACPFEDLRYPRDMRSTRTIDTDDAA